MNVIFQSSTLAIAFAVCIYAACAYAMVLGICTVRKLAHNRTVARAVGVLIAVTAFLTICAGFIPRDIDHAKGPLQLQQVLQVLGLMINVLVLKLLTKPCYQETTCNGEVKLRREIV